MFVFNFRQRATHPNAYEKKENSFSEPLLHLPLSHFRFETNERFRLRIFISDSPTVNISNVPGNVRNIKNYTLIAFN